LSTPFSVISFQLIQEGLVVSILELVPVQLLHPISEVVEVICICLVAAGVVEASFILKLHASAVGSRASAIYRSDGASHTEFVEVRLIPEAVPSVRRGVKI